MFSLNVNNLIHFLQQEYKAGLIKHSSLLLLEPSSRVTLSNCSIFIQTQHHLSILTIIQYLSYFPEFYCNSSAIMVTATPGKKPPTSGAKLENDLFDSFASRKTRDCRQHCFAAVNFEELILLFDNCVMMSNVEKS